jgi:hypothetical protein
VRLLAYAAFLLATVALGGCGGSSDEATWDGPPEPSADGTVAVDGFGDYTAEVEETWEGSPATAAGVFLRLDQRTAVRTTIGATASPEGSGPQTVVVTLDGLADDSIRAERWTLSFQPDDDVYRLTDARWAQRCQPDRGHADFSPEPCV